MNFAKLALPYPEATFTPCSICREFSSVLPPGYIYVKSSLNNYAVQECECHLKWREAHRTIAQAKNCQLWTSKQAWEYDPEIHYLGTQSRSHIKLLQTFIERFKSKDPQARELVWYFYGAPGTQKTTLAQWIGLELVKAKISVYYIYMHTLLHDILWEDISFDKKSLSSSYPTRTQLMNVSCLIIDEAFHKEKSLMYKSGSTSALLENFLKERIDIYRKSTIFISLVPPSDISQQGGSKSLQYFIDRCTQKTQLEFKDVYEICRIQNFKPEDIFLK